MKKFGKIWPVLFSLMMMAFVFFIGWQIYATASVKSRTAEAEEDLKRQKGMLKLQQVEAEKSLAEIAYYQDMINDLQPEYDVILSKKARKKALGVQLKSAQETGDDEDEYEYVEADEDEEEDYIDEDF